MHVPSSRAWLSANLLRRLAAQGTVRDSITNRKCRPSRLMATSAKSNKTQDADLVKAALQNIRSGKGVYDLVDIGVNLADSSYDKDRDEVIERARDAGVSALIVTGCDLPTSSQAKWLATEHAGLYFTAGVHPHNAKHCDSNTIQELRDLAAHPQCVAIGECGLDFNRNFSPPDVQREWFANQIDLACELKKPLFLHCREANKDLVSILKEHKLTAPAVVHCFTGNLQELTELLDMGLHIGITGWICDDRPDRGGIELANLVQLIPQDKLMIETDGPYLTPRTIRPSKARPRRNEPALLPFVLQKVAQHLEEDEESVAKRTTNNAEHFFGIRIRSNAA